MDNEQNTEHEVLDDEYEQAGLNRETMGGLNVYTLDLENEDAKKRLDRLKEVIISKRVAAEVGPGNQLDSLLFAADHARADVVIGIDLNFNFSVIRPPSLVTSQSPTIILLKGDVWGNQHIHEFFGSNKVDRSKRLAVYSQMVSPDTDVAEALIGPVTSLSKEGYMIVLDSGATERMGSEYYPEHAVERSLMTQSGNSNPTHLDWVRQIYRKCEQVELDMSDYERGVVDGKYPPSAYLRDGKMLVIQKPLIIK